MRILIYQIGALGDTIVGIPALKAVRRHFGSKAELFYLHVKLTSHLVKPSDLLSKLSLVEGFLEYKYGSHLARRLFYAAELWLNLIRKRFDVVVYLAPGERNKASVQRDKYFFRLCRIRQLLGFHAFSAEELYPRKNGRLSATLHEAICRMRRLQIDGIDTSIEGNFDKPFLDIPKADMGFALSWLNENRIYKSWPLVALCPGTKQSANQWPLERFASIGNRISKSKECEIVVVGGPADRKNGEQLRSCNAAHINAAGLFSPLGSAAVLSQCQFMIGLDTGTTHLAAACGVPCIALFSAHDNPGRWSPLGTQHRVIRKWVPCEGCKLEICPKPDHPCMHNISVDDVWQAVSEMITIDRRK